MTRDELVEAVSREVFARTNRGSPNDGWSGPDDWRIITKITGIYLDVAGPLIRDHEQAYARRELLADLRGPVPLEETSPGLLQALRALGDEYGPAGVVGAALKLIDGSDQ